MEIAENDGPTRTETAKLTDHTIRPRPPSSVKTSLSVPPAALTAIQGKAKKRSPGCENFSGKLRLRWLAQKSPNLGPTFYLSPLLPPLSLLIPLCSVRGCHAATDKWPLGIEDFKLAGLSKITIQEVE